MPLDGSDDALPVAPLRIRLLDRTGADDRDAQGVDAVADRSEQRREEREGREHGHDADEDRAGCQALHDRARHEQHAEHGDDEGRAAEQHRAARGRARDSDRVELRLAFAALLAVPRDDEERVVDAEGEPHAREHVHDEHGEAERLRQHRRQPERDDDGHDRHEDRHEAGHDGAEDEQQDDEGCRQAELQLAGLQVVLREVIEVVV
jgi:hypothetical protein